MTKYERLAIAAAILHFTAVSGCDPELIAAGIGLWLALGCATR